MAKIDIKALAPRNRLIGAMPKIGIQPTIDGRRKSVRESLENQTMDMATRAADLLRANLRHANGLPMEGVIPSTRIGGVGESTRTAARIEEPTPGAGHVLRQRHQTRFHTRRKSGRARRHRPPLLQPGEAPSSSRPFFASTSSCSPVTQPRRFGTTPAAWNGANAGSDASRPQLRSTLSVGRLVVRADHLSAWGPHPEELVRAVADAEVELHRVALQRRQAHLSSRTTIVAIVAGGLVAILVTVLLTIAAVAVAILAPHVPVAILAPRVVGASLLAVGGGIAMLARWLRSRSNGFTRDKCRQTPPRQSTKTCPSDTP